MTPEERAKSIMPHIIERGWRDYETIVQAICAAVEEQKAEGERQKAKAVEAEREACAQIADEWPNTHNPRGWHPDEVSDNIAAAIRARAETK